MFYKSPFQYIYFDNSLETSVNIIIQVFCEQMPRNLEVFKNTSVNFTGKLAYIIVSKGCHFTCLYVWTNKLKLKIVQSQKWM